MTSRFATIAECLRQSIEDERSHVEANSEAIAAAQAATNAEVEHLTNAFVTALKSSIQEQVRQELLSFGLIAPSDIPPATESSAPQEQDPDHGGPA